MGEKAFICTFCARSFGRLEHQKRHELIHVRDKPFQCSTCSRGFTRRDALQRHETTHAEQYTSLLQTGARACSSCATARVKCSGGQRCQRCERRGWPCVYPSDGATGNILSVQISPQISEEGLNAALDNPQAADVYLDLEAQHGPADNDFWDPTILASTNWLGSVDLDAFDPTLPEFDVTFTLPEPSRPHSVADVSPRPLATAASPAMTVNTGITSDSQGKSTEDGEYYVDGQPARLPRVKRRRASKATPTVQSTQTTWSLQEPVLASQGDLSQAFVISSDSHDRLRHLYQQLCLAPNPLCISFDNHEFPSKAFFENLIAATVTNVTSILPFFHLSQYTGDDLHWLEVISLASLACHFADMSPKHHFAISMHEFVRRLIHWADEQAQSVEGIDDLGLARVLIVHVSGAEYCGDHRLGKHALGLNARLCATFRRLICVHRDKCGPPRGSTDPAFLSWRTQESFTRLMYSIWLHDCMTAYHFQRKPSLALAEATIPLPFQEKLWSVRNENEWLSVKAQSAILLSPSPTLIEALQQLYVDKWLPRERGEFARVLMIHALLQRSWEVEAYYKNPLSHWDPVAHRQESADVLPSGAIWLPAIPAFTKWQNSACDALDVLHWQANATIGQSSGLEHPTVLHLHVARVVLLAPYLDIVAHVESMTGVSVSETQEETYGLRTVNHSSSAALSIRRWAINHQYKARLAAIHAGVAFWHVRRYSTDAYHESPSIALAALTLWAFGTYARKQPSTVRQSVGNPSVGVRSHHMASPDQVDDDDDLESCNIILLDRPTDDELVQQFIKNGDRMEAHISGVGDLYAPQSPRLVLKQACRLLRQSEKCWGIASRWIRLLERLAELST